MSSGPLTVSVHITCTRPPSLRASSAMMSTAAGSVMPFSFRISTSSPAFMSQPSISMLRAPRRTSSSE
jgi:Mg/Co/Ni transporter MgtE